ncbi:receptor-like protein kinase ANXUR2 [Telopea speciosissima]|uniref:receptor-like protein kinase ANXUR2 n=1 Tax=Telopea speciosissima TaxID=54955 RepID=UPI001CC5860D|nr:receptor-like protein kinase ANXUR2 [Telopea speciosissima]
MRIKTHLLFSLVLFSFICNSLCASNVTKTKSISYLLNCGVADGELADSDGRKWGSDSKYLESADDSISAKAQTQDPSLPSTVPYMSARIFTKKSTYNFKVSSTHHYWIRLHFYPSDYSSLNASDAYFGVIINGITVLKNFSASITAKALTQAYILREFSFPASSNGSLQINFLPSSSHNGSFAFINGIEIIPMPELFISAKMVGYSDQSIDVGTSALQTMYRLNVGGSYIPPTNDSGSLSRTWFDDSPYVFGAGVGIVDDIGKNVPIHYSTDTPEYIAPVDVYNTFRSMGSDMKVNQNYNLTWVFTVDANFTYLIRLHFCELLLTKVNQRSFQIFINNQTADDAADVLVWAGSKGVPVYKDFAVYVEDSPEDDEELWLSMRPAVSLKSEFYDSMLNGLEIFKMSDTAGNLAGPNPVPSEMMLEAESDEPTRAFTPSSSSESAHMIGGAAGGAAAVVVAAIFIAFYQTKRRDIGVERSASSSGWLPLYGNSHTSSSKSTISGKSVTSSNISSLAISLCRHFSLAEIRKGTKNFDESQVIGVGGFGKVYKGVIDGGTKVAIKRANPSSEQGIHEFQTEIEMLSKLRHRHLVSLIGYCEEDDEMILVYDYMAHGTLREHLYKGNKTILSWKQRLEICIGAARGLHYLHTGAKYTIIHRDVKTTNILLDEQWVAKVSDFGLSKTGPNLNQTHVSTVVKGSFGYLDPEYFRRQQLTEKSDVYSFGVVLFEVLCARPALNPTLAKEQVSLADWALHCQKKGILEDIIDPHLKGKINPECLKKFADAAEKCLSDQGVDRPSMGDVLWNLEFALQLQENPDGLADSDWKGTEKPSQADMGIHDSCKKNLFFWSPHIFIFPGFFCAYRVNHSRSGNLIKSSTKPYIYYTLICNF